MITYLLVGILWTMFFDWLIQTFGPEEGEGLNIKGVIIHTFGWPLAIILVVRMFINRNDD